VFQPAEWNYKASEKLAEMITERTEGHITVTYYGQNELDCYGDSVEQAVANANWMGLEEPSLFADYVGDAAVVVGPMLYNNDDEYNYVMESDLVQDIKDRLAEQNIHILDTHYSFGYRSIITNKDITTPADLKGVKLRSTTSSLFIKTIECLGATPVPMSFTECLSAISSGVVDGFEGSTSTLAGAGAPYELVKKVALTNHFIATRWLFMPEDLYQSIPEKWRDILDECAVECGEWEQQMCAEDEATQIEKMKTENGVTWNDVDIDAFTEACAPVYDWMVEEYGATPELHQQLVDLIKDYRATHS
jgi:TRAP-type C4-dicarboxylate transport system substrate-binding protein